MEGRRNKKERRFGAGGSEGECGGMEGGKRKKEWEREKAIGAGVEAEGDRVLGRVNERMGRKG